MIRGDLPPVGSTILTKPSTLIPSFDGFDAFYVDSGTSALALAIIAAKQLQPEITKPEVIVPAYCCPDLVSAAVYAGTQVVVVDISPNDPAYDLEQLGAAINSNTIAVIAVNFLGIKERLTQIKSLLPDHCHLIEDNAQSFEPLQAPEQLVGDMVITSFGRGKPVSLLGGGLCLVREDLSERLTLAEQIKPAQPTSLLTAKIAVYNWLIKPTLYPLINRNPLLSVGETKYKPLNSIHALDKQRLTWLDKNIQAYREQSTFSQQAFDKILAEHEGLTIQRTIEPNEKQGKLLRYPILCSTKEQRDIILHELNNSGLGASVMYGKNISDIEKPSFLSIKKPIPSATDLSRRIITLPCHENVDSKNIINIKNIICNCL